jgi:hypothetical protein
MKFTSFLTVLSFALAVSCRTTPPAEKPAPEPTANKPADPPAPPKTPEPEAKPTPPKPPEPPKPPARPVNKKEVRGRVVDADGKALAGAKVCTRWRMGETLVPGNAAETMTSDADGNFTGQVTFARRPILLMAVDADQKCAGFVVLDEKNIDAAAEIKAGPLGTVKGHVESTELGKAPDGVDVSVSIVPNNVHILGATPKDGKFSIRLPVGEYQVYVRASGPQVQSSNQKVSVKADQPEVDLGRIDLKLTPLGKMQGKEPPAWNVTDARGVDKSVKLSDYKGKWLLIEFWGYW